MRRSLIILAAIASLALTGTGALADDIVIPWWRDGKDPNPETNKSTLQWWEFGDNSSANVPAEDGYVNPQDALLIANIFPPATWTSGPLFGRSGVWSLSEGAIMTLQIPNYTDGPEKKIWIQLTWMPQQEDAEPSANLMLTLPPYTFFDESLVTTQPLGGDGWMHSTYLIVVQPNPSLEAINITGDIYVDEVVVDTICPEPATMALLGLAVPFVLRRRRRN